MDRAQAVAILREHAPELKGRGITGLYLFGSIARGEGTQSSDVDVFFDYVQDGHFSLFEIMDIQDYVETALQAKADVVPRSSLHPRLRDSIVKEAIKIF